MLPLPPADVPVIHYSSYSAFWGALQRSGQLAPLRELCACSQGSGGRGVNAGGGRTGGGSHIRERGKKATGGWGEEMVGEDEFRLMGCVLILLYMCAYTAVYVCAYCLMCVLILLHVS